VFEAQMIPFHFTLIMNNTAIYTDLTQS